MTDKQNTERQLKKFTQEDDRKIKEWYETPKGQKLSRIEFAKSINHTSRAVKERYEHYIRSERKFEAEDIKMLLDAYKKYPRQWTTISKIFKGKFSPLIIRDEYSKLEKLNRTRTRIIHIPEISPENDQLQNVINDADDSFFFFNEENISIPSSLEQSVGDSLFNYD